MQFDCLTKSESAEGWGESVVQSGFATYWDRELFGLDVPDWRSSVVQLVQCAAQRNSERRVVVADMGCGAGVYARHFLAAGIDCDYHGFDHNEDILSAACARWTFLPHERVHLHQMDVAKCGWPLDDHTFDVVIWDTTLSFCEDAESAFAESARVCRDWIILARTPIVGETWCERVQYYNMQQPSPTWHFDEATCQRLARDNGLHLMLGAGRDDTHLFSRQPLRDGLALRPRLRIGHAFHEAFVRERVERLLAQQDGPWAVFGGGLHTRWLLRLIPIPVRRRFEWILDDAASATPPIEGVAVAHPDSVDARSVSGVLISSDTIEERLFERAVAWQGRSDRIHRLYDGVPGGPYDKRIDQVLCPHRDRPREVASVATSAGHCQVHGSDDRRSSRRQASDQSKLANWS